MKPTIFFSASISQAGIAARALTLMEGSEEKEQKKAAPIELKREIDRAIALTTKPQRRLYRTAIMSYLTQTKEKGGKL